MKKQIIIGLTLLTIVLGGCFLLSLNPIYTPDTLVRPEWLDGKWMSKDSTFWTFAPDTNESEGLELMQLKIDERITCINDNAKKETPLVLDSFKISTLINNFSAGVTQIKGQYFLDLLAAKILTGSGFHSQHFIHGHSISKLKFKEDTMWISTLEDDWAKSLEPKKGKKLGLIKSEKNWIITASTKELRAFLAKSANDTNIFPINENYFVKIKK